ncbi:permease for cytosine/purines, uracil, thiamine, allantoin-domain-containing protein [Roridomyces roridus]|uniref:Permease for cytosine/purines, uracil, thiamine, allantoin-domain-containing protein n=1 Tax=Roridomyces roridus TaxID=1738132 RepID=A0AAD7G2B6_9AGAR|nr:permease for cytosine/purines, uracil, thiamine, allantoin-domain-containing protein [Roridomyces roridus]
MSRPSTKSRWSLSALALEPEPSTFASDSKWARSNRDMDPVPPELQTWTTWNYIAYWISDATNTATWELASSMIAVGLSWRQALPAIAVGHIIIGSVMVLNGTIGARLHVAFPVITRSSFGFWFSYFAVVSRVVLSMFWFAIQSYTGSECVLVMLKAIWPGHIARIPNRLPESAGISTVQMMSYFLFWLIQLPFLLVSPQRIRYLFVLKAAIVPATWLAMLIWAMHEAPPSVSLVPKHATLSGSAASWAWLSSLNSALGIYATLAVNIPDFTRYAKNERAQYVQMLVIPVAFTLAGFCGIAVASASEVLYGEVIWDPLQLIDRWDSRAASFFAALSFALATLGTNISANSLSAANDMTVLLPKYINIRRGQVLCAIIGGWALCPWEILSSAPGFLTFMSGYTIFLGPFAAIMCIDYWIVHQCKVDVPAMYDPNGRYHYWNGINWRAAIALLFSVTPGLPGLAASINPSINVGKAARIFDIGWLYGFFVAGVLYWGLSTLFPAKETYLEEVNLGKQDRDSIENEKDGSVVYSRTYDQDLLMM